MKPESKTSSVGSLREGAAMSVTRAKGVTYWICTALVAFFMISGGFANLLLPEAIAGIVKLGYPRFFASILGVWKVLGGIAILVPRFARLKEWAYAGITFELTGAAITNAIVGHIGGPLGYGAHIAAPLIIALLALLSWALRPENRTLGGPVVHWLRPSAAWGTLMQKSTRRAAATAKKDRDSPPEARISALVKRAVG